MLLALALLAHADPLAVPDTPRAAEPALEALAAGDPVGAVRMLRRLPDEDGRLGCLLGRAERRAGHEQAAISVLAKVPDDASCARRAAFERADALLALDRPDEAEAIYATLGEQALGPDRDAATVAHLRALADQSQAPAGLLDLALTLQGSEETRLDTARALATELFDHPEHGSPSQADTHAQGPLWSAIDADPEDAEDRLLLARLAGHQFAPDILAPLGDSPDALRALAQSWGVDQWTRLALGERLLQEGLATDAKEQGRQLALVHLQPALDQVLTALDTEEALLQQAQLAAARGARTEAITSLEAWLQRFPAGVGRADAESLLETLHLERARAAMAEEHASDAIAMYEQVVAMGGVDADTAAFEAGLAERAVGVDPRPRWREVMARWPGSYAATRAVQGIARATAFDGEDADPDAAIAWLRELERDGREASAAATERERLQSKDVQIAAPGRQHPAAPATLNAVARNLDEVEVRLHTIDPLAFLRAGGTSSTLPELDVGVIAPDRSWTVPVPRAPKGQDVTFDLPVRTDGPGLFTVTIATPRREAHAVLLVSDVDLVARAVGPDLVVGVSRGARAVAGARVWVRADGRVLEALTDAHGVARLTTRASHFTVLAMVGQAPALGEFSLTPGEDPAIGVQTTLDLDRAVYLPGDRAGFRLVGHRDGHPLPGTWKLWLSTYRANLPPVTLTADAAGRVVGELPLPPNAQSEQWSLMALAPGEDEPVHVGTVRVEPEATPGRSLTVDAPHIRVREADGRPAVGVPVAWKVTGLGGASREGTTPTDEHGEINVSAPPDGLPWTLSAELVSQREVQRQVAERPDPWVLHLSHSRARPDEHASATLDGEGPARFLLTRLLPVPQTPEPPADPWVPDLQHEIDGPLAWIGPTPQAPEPVAEVEVWRQDGGTEATLPALAPGRYRLRAIPLDGRNQTATTTLQVGEDDLRLRGLPLETVAGTRLPLAVEGGPALITAETDHLLTAAMLAPGRTLPWPDDPLDDETVTLTAVAPDGRWDRRELRVRAALDVQVDVEEDGDDWVIQLHLRDATGRPARAQVALSATDERMAPAGVEASALRPGFWSGGAAGCAMDELRHGQRSSELSGALLDERRRETERRRAMAAQHGSFANNAAAQAFDEDILLEGNIGIGGLGTVGSGSGGGGMGYGAGAIVLGGAALTQVPADAVRERVLWRVAQVDGELRLRVPRPPQAARWRVRARAVGAHHLGEDEQIVSTQAHLRLTLAEVNPGLPGDEVAPLVSLSNGTDATCAGRVELGEEHIPLTLAAGEGRRLQGAARPPGTTLPVRLVCDDHVITEQLWRFPLAEGTPAPDGVVLNAAVGPESAVALALAPDPLTRTDPLRAARAGRAALAALHVAPRDARLLERARQLQASLIVAPSPTPEGLLFLTELAEVQPLPAGSIQALAVQIPADGSLALAWARVRAGLPVEDAVIARLLRGAEAMDDEDAATLARLLIRQGRADEARALVRGEGPQAVLARRALGESVTLSTAPPPVGEAARADWLRAFTPSPARGVVRQGERDLLDLSEGGVLRVALAAGPVVAPPGALIWRSGPAPSGDQRPLVLRVPAGLDGRPLPFARVEREDACPDPCVLRPGDSLWIGVPMPRIPAGLSLRDPVNAWRIEASSPGAFTLAGLTDTDGDPMAAVRVQVTTRADPSPAAPSFALALAEQAEDASLIDAWPRLEDWPDGLVPRVARLRMAAPDLSAAERVRRFEDLRVGAPDTALDFETVIAVAHAYAELGRPARAVAAWRAGLGAAFAKEAVAARALEQLVGPVVSLRTMRALTGRYPVVPSVEAASYHLPERLGGIAEDALPDALVERGVTATDLRLLSAAWDREFLALYPDSDHAPEAGFHLVQTLYQLRAWKQAATWAERLAAAHRDSPLLDRFEYLAALAAGERGERDLARTRLQHVATGTFPQEGGRLGPASLAPDARFALARLDEASGRIAAARDGYDAVADEFPEAVDARAALDRVVLEVAPLTRLGPDERAQVELRVANIDEVHVRAYALDLRTVFLRDRGLGSASQVEVAGVSPAWSGTRHLRTGPFARSTTLDLPLSGSGAWLVQVDGAERAASALIVRSALQADVSDDGGQRRVALRRGSQTAAGIAVRAFGPGGEVIASHTDLRGVALLPVGAPFFCFDGTDVAFSDPDEPLSSSRQSPARGRKGKDALFRNLDKQLQQQRMESDQRYEDTFGTDNASAVEAQRL